jgi:hypothetical protein
MRHKNPYLFGSKCWAPIGDNSKLILISPSFGLESFGLTISELAIAETLKYNKRKENVIAYALTLYNPSKTLNESLIKQKKHMFRLHF